MITGDQSFWLSAFNTRKDIIADRVFASRKRAHLPNIIHFDLTIKNTLKR
jgi:hypothetical protein